MGERAFLFCDVFNTIKGTGKFSIEVKDSEGRPVWSKSPDLSPRAVDRLKRFLIRATQPPTKK